MVNQKNYCKKIKNKINKLTVYCSLLFKAEMRTKDINLYTMTKIGGEVTTLSLLHPYH